MDEVVGLGGRQRGFGVGLGVEGAVVDHAVPGFGELALLGEGVALEVEVVGDEHAGLIEVGDEAAFEVVGGGRGVGLAVVEALDELFGGAVVEVDVRGSTKGVVRDAAGEAPLAAVDEGLAGHRVEQPPRAGVGAHRLEDLPQHAVGVGHARVAAGVFELEEVALDVEGAGGFVKLVGRG